MVTAVHVVEPLVLKQGEIEYKLKFNCKPCEMEIWEKDAEFEIEEEDSEDLLETMEQELLQRRFGPPVRLEVNRKIKPELLSLLIDELEITEAEVIQRQGPIDLTCLNQIADIDRKDLKYPVFRSKTSKFLLETESEDSEANDQWRDGHFLKIYLLFSFFFGCFQQDEI